MLNPDKVPAALYAIHLVLVKAAAAFIEVDGGRFAKRIRARDRRVDVSRAQAAHAMSVHVGGGHSDVLGQLLLEAERTSDTAPRSENRESSTNPYPRGA